MKNFYFVLNEDYISRHICLCEKLSVHESKCLRIFSVLSVSTWSCFGHKWSVHRLMFYLFSPSPVRQPCCRCTANLNISRRKARADSDIKLLWGILWYHCIWETWWTRIKTHGNNIRIVQAQQITLNRGMAHKKIGRFLFLICFLKRAQQGAPRETICFLFSILGPFGGGAEDRVSGGLLWEMLWACKTLPLL